jgi:peptide methionine sulfoxide reductase MsrA
MEHVCLIFVSCSSPSGIFWTEYRSAIFYHTPEQLQTAKKVTDDIQAKRFTPARKKIVTEIVEAGPFWNAEDHHQLYLLIRIGVL